MKKSTINTVSTLTGLLTIPVTEKFLLQATEGLGKGVLFQFGRIATVVSLAVEVAGITTRITDTIMTAFNTIDIHITNDKNTSDSEKSKEEDTKPTPTESDESEYEEAIYIPTIYYPTKEKAEEALDRLRDIITMNDCYCSVYRWLNDISERDISVSEKAYFNNAFPNVNKWGWSDIDIPKMSVKKENGKWYVDLPRPFNYGGKDPNE